MASSPTDRPDPENVEEEEGTPEAKGFDPEVSGSFAAAVAEAARAVEGESKGEEKPAPSAPAPAAGPAEGALEKEVAALKDRLLRTAADFENWKRRAKKEYDEAANHGRESLLKEILPVIDNLERALKHAKEDDPLAVGIRLVEKQLIAALEKFGIKRFKSLGEAFDPTMHEAIQHQETTEHPPGTVANEFSAGYTINGRLLRPAMVAVAKPPSNGSGEGAG